MSIVESPYVAPENNVNNNSIHAHANGESETPLHSNNHIVNNTIQHNINDTIQNNNIEKPVGNNSETTIENNETTVESNDVYKTPIMAPRMVTSPMGVQIAAPINSYSASGGVLIGGHESARVGVGVGVEGSIIGEKKKRGRPRKYPIDGSQGSTGQKPVKTESEMTTSNGKRRGRPPGSVNKKHKHQGLSSVGPPGAGFNPQVIVVQAGEDVHAKIIAFSQNGNQAVCIMSANGAISNVTLRQAGSSGGTVTYEGTFEILTLSGSYMILEYANQRSKLGGLSVLLAGSDGRMLGGSVSGLLIAASPVQVVVVGFNLGQEQKSPNQVDYSAGPKPIMGSPTSRGTPSESSGSPINHSNGNPINMGNNMGVVQWK